MSSMLVRSRGVSEALVEPLALMAGSPTEGFADPYERTFPRLYAYVASLLRDRGAAEDVTAQAFERAYRKRRSYRAGRGSMEAWLFGIARKRRARRAAQAPPPCRARGRSRGHGGTHPR
jgi:DNA-directed RNA polymerase specialized sigma24 family protein